MNQPPPTERQGESESGGAILVLVAVLAIYNVLRSTVVPDGVHFATNVSTAALIFAIGVRAGLSRSELGVAPERLRDGVRLGSMVAGLVAAVVVAAAALPATRDYFDDGRVDVSLAEMLLRVLVVIPMGTVLAEELVFRGVLHGLLRRRLASIPATVWGALLFGLWHVFPVWWGFDLATGDQLGRVGAVVGTFLATSAAGVGFIWLRNRSGHLAAPILVHVATNSVPFAVAWFVT